MTFPFPIFTSGVSLAGLFGSLVTRASDANGVNYSAGTLLTFDTEAYDVGAWHSTGANTDRMTVPSNVSRVRLTAQIGVNNMASSNQFDFTLQLNDAALSPGVTLRADASTSSSLKTYIASPAITVVAGDYFNLLVTSADTSIDIVALDTWFAIERIE